MDDTNTRQAVKEYYGKDLTSKHDLKTNACCLTESPSTTVKDILSMLHPDVTNKSYGCGSPIPEDLKGLKVLDLGSGSGTDCFVLSKLVGQNGFVTGVDMTDEQLKVANSYIEYHTERFGYDRPNIEFKCGHIEDLASLEISDNSLDLVVSNCVINLSPNKHKVFSEIFRTLKPGGELYFSDVFCDRRLPQELIKDKELLGECLAGAMYEEDFRRIMYSLGILDYRTVSRSVLDINQPGLEAKTGLANFESVTIRAFKLNDIEDCCEDYGQVATYLGSIADHPNSFALDDHHLFETHKPMLVCGNTASMLANTRFGTHFRIDGDRSRHFGLFDCSREVSQKTIQTLSGCC